MKRERNIFDALDKKCICYAVACATIRFKSVGAEASMRDYYIMVSAEDCLSIRGLGFKRSENQDYDIMERDLNEDEVKIFKSLQSKNFLLVKKDNEGRIFELKTKGFKQHYEEYLKIKPYRKLLTILAPISGILSKPKALNIDNEIINSQVSATHQELLRLIERTNDQIQIIRRA